MGVFYEFTFAHILIEYSLSLKADLTSKM